MYGKIYEQTFTGSMYGSGTHIFAVWSYIIAHTKPDAMVELNPVALASIMGEEVSKIEQAIECFKSPDPRSRSKEFEGRRLIQKGEFIYFVPQYHKYHGFANNKERREYFAQKKREQRQRDKECQTVKSKESKNVKQSDADTNSKSDDKHKEEEIYCAYPRKVAKPEALKAIRTALSKIPFDDLLQKTKAFATARNGDVAFCPHPATWFNQERYNDDPSTWIQSHVQSSSKPECLKMSWPHDWREAQRQLRYLQGQREKHPEVEERIEALSAQFKL